MRTRVIAIPIVAKLQVFSNSETVSATLDLDVPELQGLLPQAESIEAHWMLNNLAADILDWNLLGTPGFDRDHELSATAFFATDQSAIGSQKSAITNFGTSLYMQHVRLQLRWRLHDVASPVAAQGELSLTLYITTKGQ